MTGLHKDTGLVFIKEGIDVVGDHFTRLYLSFGFA
jgi:hypothetical protein